MSGSIVPVGRNVFRFQHSSYRCKDKSKIWGSMSSTLCNAIISLAAKQLHNMILPPPYLAIYTNTFYAGNYKIISCIQATQI